VIEEELGRPLQSVYTEISEEPVAAASLGQVRRPEGRKPGVFSLAETPPPGPASCAGSEGVVHRPLEQVFGRAPRKRVAPAPAPFTPAPVRSARASKPIPSHRTSACFILPHPIPSHPISPYPTSLYPQVYRAVLRETGERVAVKVQRPGIGESIAIDMLLLRRLMGVVDDNLPQARRGRGRRGAPRLGQGPPG
jgi:hypothetical protein